jgi:transposase
LVEPFLGLSFARTGRPPRDRRTLLNGIFWILCTGAPRRDVRGRFGPWQAVYDHFRNWRRSGVFARILEGLKVRFNRQGLLDWELFADNAKHETTPSLCGTLHATLSYAVGQTVTIISRRMSYPPN